jgi:predicted O-methyltransferase YrrM
MPCVFWHRADFWHGLLADSVDTTASHPETWDFLAQLVTGLNARTVVEAGTYRGHAALAMAEAMRVGCIDGCIYTADVVDHGVEALAEQAGLSRYLSFTRDRFETMVEPLDGIDLAFIDASEEQTPALRIDYLNLVWEKLAPNGVAVVDDATNDEWPGAALLREKCGLYLPGGHGLAIFQKKP